MDAQREAVLARHHVQQMGAAGAGRTLVFIHGLGTDQTAWAPVAQALAGRHHLVKMDNAGAGAADPAAYVQHRYLSLKGYVADLIEVCEALGLRGVTLVGHSVGAMVAALASIERPGLCEALVMVGASPRYLDDPSRGYHGGFTPEALQQTYSAVLHQFPDWVAGFAPAAMGNPERPDLAAAFAQALQRIPPDRLLTALCATQQSDHRADLPRIRVPTLLLQAQDDLFVPAGVAQWMQQQIPGSRLVQIDAQGHFPQLSHPAAVIAAIEAFLAETGAAGA